MTTSFRPFPTVGGPIQKWVLPLIAKVGDVLQPLGTGFVVGPDGLFVTAAHVIDEANKLAVRRLGNDGKFRDHYEFFAVEVTNELVPGSNDTVSRILPINRVWAPEVLDIGFGYLTLPNREDDSLFRLNHVRIRPAIPKVGDRITAYGYHKMTASLRPDKPNSVKYEHQTAISCGEILEVHPEYRDRGLMSFPCFQTNARFDHGMSGGPIVNESGLVIGVVCSSPDPAGSPSYISYGSLIWPIFGCEVKAAAGQSSQAKETFFDLASQGRIQTDSALKFVRMVEGESGRRSMQIHVPKE